MATDEEKFQAAVNLVRGMPSQGPFQPSYELMLKFYALFKQATEGPCKQPKPSFWEVVAKAKWEAWHKLGNISREEAMKLYVKELKKVGENIVSSDKLKKLLENSMEESNVTDFINILQPFYQVAYENEPFPAVPDHLKHLMPQNAIVTKDPKESDEENLLEDKTPREFQNNSSEDEYEDAAEYPIYNYQEMNNLSKEALEAVLIQLESELATLKCRLDNVEREKSEVLEEDPELLVEGIDNKKEEMKSNLKNSMPRCLSFADLSLPTVIGAITWPFIAFIILNKFTGQR